MTGQMPIAPRELYERLWQQLDGTSSCDAVEVLFDLFCHVAGSTLKGPELVDSLVEKLIPAMRRRVAEAYKLAHGTGEEGQKSEFAMDFRTFSAREHRENDIATEIIRLLRERAAPAPEAVMGCSRALASVIATNARSTDAMHEMAAMVLKLIEHDIETILQRASHGATIQ